MEINKFIYICLDIIQKDNDTSTCYVVRTSPMNITSLTITKNSLHVNLRTFPDRTFDEHLNIAMIMAYCIYDKPIKLINKYAPLSCWLCDWIGSNETIFKYNTIFNNYVYLHAHCYDKCNSYRNNCQKKVTSKYTCLYSGNQVVIYNMREVYLVQFNNHMSMSYTSLCDSKINNILRPYTGLWLTAFKHQYINLIKREFIDSNLHHVLLIKHLILEDVNTIIMHLYVKLILKADA